MKLRSLLFVPGDRPDRMAKAVASGADVVILDLEDSVSPERKPWARKDVATFLGSNARNMPLFVRVNPLGSAWLDDDIEMIWSAGPDGLVLPKSESDASVAALVTILGSSAIPILPIATEMPRAIFGLGSYGTVASRLCGITWGAEDLPAAMGAATAREADGSYTAPYQLARSLTLFGAHAAGVPAIETVYPDIRDLSGLAGYATRARRDGFAGMMAIHPDQVPVINDAFRPSQTELDHARKIVAAFQAAPKAGVLEVDGRMVDRPHLVAAERMLRSL